MIAAGIDYPVRLQKSDKDYLQPPEQKSFGEAYKLVCSDKPDCEVKAEFTDDKPKQDALERLVDGRNASQKAQEKLGTIQGEAEGCRGRAQTMLEEIASKSGSLATMAEAKGKEATEAEERHVKAAAIAVDDLKEKAEELRAQANRAKAVSDSAERGLEDASRKLGILNQAVRSALEQKNYVDAEKFADVAEEAADQIEEILENIGKVSAAGDGATGGAGIGESSPSNRRVSIGWISPLLGRLYESHAGEAREDGDADLTTKPMAGIMASYEWLFGPGRVGPFGEWIQMHPVKDPEGYGNLQNFSFLSRVGVGSGVGPKFGNDKFSVKLDLSGRLGLLAFWYGLNLPVGGQTSGVTWMIEPSLGSRADINVLGITGFVEYLFSFPGFNSPHTEGTDYNGETVTLDEITRPTHSLVFGVAF